MQEKINIQQNNRRNIGESRKKLPLDLPLPHRKYRSSRYQRRSQIKYGEDADKAPSFLRNLVICAAILLLVVILKSVDTPFTRNVLGYVRDAVTMDFNFEETLGKLKFVDKFLSEDVKAVFGEQTSSSESLDKTVDDLKQLGLRFTVPAEGKVVGFFGDKTEGQLKGSNTGIDIQGDQNDNLYAVADGYVTAVGEDESRGKYLEVNHGSNVTTLYARCSELIVDVGYRVKRGEQIGKMGRTEEGKPLLHFETWVNGKPVDPLSIIDTGK